MFQKPRSDENSQKPRIKSQLAFQRIYLLDHELNARAIETAKSIHKIYSSYLTARLSGMRVNIQTKLTVKSSFVDKLHRGFEAHLLQRRHAWFNASAVEGFVNSFETHVISDQTEMSRINLDSWAAKIRQIYERGLKISGLDSRAQRMRVSRTRWTNA